MAEDNPLFIVDGMEIINTEIFGYRLNMDVWEYTCSDILDSFTTKTSSVATDLAKNNIKEYTYWYQKSPDGSLKSFGKERPDIESMYPPKPEYPILFDYKIINEKHILVLDVDFENNRELFGTKCFVFPYSSLISLLSSFTSSFVPGKGVA